MNFNGAFTDCSLILKMEENKRVGAEILDELKTMALLGEACTLQFRGTNGGMVTVQTKIRDVFEDADGQFLLTADGLSMQLHQVVAINGKPLENFC